MDGKYQGEDTPGSRDLLEVGNGRLVGLRMKSH